MTTRNEHGKTVYRFAWLVEWSLFSMAMIVALLNIYTAKQQGASVAALPAIALAVGWIVIACIELCTIPLAGSLAFTRWREKPLNLVAVLGLSALSMFTVYELNEAASFNLTRGARLAVIENENDRAEIKRIESRIEDIGDESHTDHAWMAKVKDQYKDELKAHEEQRSASLNAIDAEIDQLNLSMRGNPVLTDRINDLNAKIDKKRENHASLVDRQVATYEAEIKALEGDKVGVGSDAQSRVETGPFTGGSEKIAEMQKQFEAIMAKQEELRRKVQGAITTHPDITAELAMIQELESQRDSESVASSLENKAALAAMRVDRQKTVEEWKVSRAAIESAYQVKVDEYQASVESEDKMAEARKESADVLRAGVIARTKEIDAQYEPILYYRMAKWFQTGDGLPTKENYAQVQWFIFAPIGAFYSLVSIALAYLGMSMRRSGNDQNVPARVARNSIRREKRMQTLQERNLLLEEQACAQTMDLVNARQEAFAAIKKIPQVVKLHEPDVRRPSKSMMLLPWCACMLMSLVALGAVIYSINGPANANHAMFSNVPVAKSVSQETSSTSSVDGLLDPVVMIQTEDGVGSGFFIQEDGLLLTNAHVIEGAEGISILTRQGPSFPGRILEVDESRDLALIKVDAFNMPTLALSAATNQHIGEDVMVIGSPLGLEWSVSKGIVSSIRSNDGTTYLQTDAAMNHGNSGGPLIHLASRTVLGINTLKLDDSNGDGIGFAVSADEVRKAFPDHQ